MVPLWSRLSALIAEQFVAAGVLGGGAEAGAAAASSDATARMVADKVELVNDAEALTRAALDYPLRATLAAEPKLAAGLAEVAATIVAMHRAGELPDCTGPEAGPSFKAWSKALGEVLGRKGKGLFMPMRVALTGRSSGPDLPAQLQLLALAPAAVVREPREKRTRRLGGWRRSVLPAAPAAWDARGGCCRSVPLRPPRTHTSWAWAWAALRTQEARLGRAGPRVAAGGTWCSR